MKITIVVPAIGLSGGLRVAAVHAEALTRRGHDVLLVASGRRPPSFTQRMRAMLRGGAAKDPWADDSHFRDLRTPVHVLDTWRPVVASDVPDADAIVATWWETAEWVNALPASKGAKAYFIQGLETWDNLPVERVEATWRSPMQKITVSRWLAEVARDRFQDPTAIVVNNGVDVRRFDAPPRGKSPRPTVGFVYSESSIKGCDVILKALALVRDEVPDLRVVSFGMEAPRGEIPLPEWVEFSQSPPHDAIVATYAACDVWVWASRQEGFGLPLLEALACRTPLAATPAGAAPELIEESGGTLVPFDDHQAMAHDVLRTLRLEDEAWRTLSSRARATAQAHSWDGTGEAFEKALRVAVERSTAGAR